MAIGVVLALMGTTCLIQLANIQLVNGPAPKTGKILRQWWTGISGSAVGDLTSSPDYPDTPSDARYIGSLEGPANWNDRYGTRIRGYLHPFQTGNYTFWIAGDDTAQLWLSSDALVPNAVLIASVPAGTDPYEWNKYPAQQSAAILLAGGHKYYIEVLHKEDTGTDHIAAAWQRNGTDSPQVIKGLYLSPWTFGQMGDLTEDNQVDYDDVKRIAQDWLITDCDFDLSIDMNGDCLIDTMDLWQLAQNWLVGAD